jgi:hypothetical protein
LANWLQKFLPHCFSPFGTDPSIPSKMSFGNGSEVLGDDVVSTPLISKHDRPLYFVTLRLHLFQRKIVFVEKYFKRSRKHFPMFTARMENHFFYFIHIFI